MMKDFFQVDRPVFEASAPGRIDVMGGVAEYSGGLLLQMPTVERMRIKIQLTEEGFFTVVREEGGSQRSALVFVNEVLSWGDVGRVDTSTGLHLASQESEKNEVDVGRVDTSTGLHVQDHASENFWTRYVLGCFLLASKTFGFPLTGARVYVTGDLPVGQGLSSSSALEVATLRVLAKAHDFKFETLQLGRLAQRVQNEVVGVVRGLSNPLASHHGVAGALLPMVFQPAKLHSSIALPGDLIIECIPTGVKSKPSEEAYTTARTAAFMGYGILAKEMGATVEQLERALQTGDRTGLPAKGYLANFDAKQFESSLEEALPEKMLGADFIAAGHVSIDQNTAIVPTRVYPVRAAAAHPVYEHACTRQFASLLAQLNQIDLPRHQVFARLGLLMLSSHASYSAIGLGHEATDEIVHDVVAKGAKRGFYGARVTGRGCGRSVVVLRKP